MSDLQPFYTISSKQCSLVLDCRENAPAILYWGPRLAKSTSPEMIAALATREALPARPEKEAPVALSPELGAGFAGSAGIRVHRDGRQWGVYSRIVGVEHAEKGRLVVTSVCDGSEIRIVHRLDLDRGSNVLVASTEITNIGESALTVDFCAAPSIPLSSQLNKIIGFEGRWANEFQLRSVERFTGSYLRENRSGRTSHDAFPGVILHAPETSEAAGAACGLHLGWSGNHRLRIDSLADGRAYAQLGELFFPGELSLASGERYRSPNLFCAHTDRGLTKLSQCFHRYVRKHLTSKRAHGSARPVNFNTWEAAYFDLSSDKLHHLADEAAKVGAERFVLDDGWFKNRRSDSVGLGDWFVDETVFPDGLTPLIDRVHARGMDFGLWIEPEMVSPDSDLYRGHPDWVLGVPSAKPVMARHQLVLDLTRPEVVDYLFERIDALLGEYPIAYLKWDMNRDLSQPGAHDGRAAGHRQTLAFYKLLERVRAAHRSVDIESCSSGGGRADFGVLAHTDRIWTSDSNDALDRLAIQKGFSFFFPAEVMGAHVGPEECAVTGRRIGLAMRAGVAMFGNMGIEADLTKFDDEQKEMLAAAIALHKKHRGLIFGGDLVRLDTAAHENAFGIVSRNRREALFSYALLTTPPHGAPGRLLLRGLRRKALYHVTPVWPIAPDGDSGSILDRIDGVPLTGDALMKAGIELPAMKPETLLVFHLTRVH